MALATDRSTELADPFAERFAQLRQPFGAEDDQGDDQDDRELHWSDVWHWPMVPAAEGDRTRFRLTCNGGRRYPIFVFSELATGKCGWSDRFAGSIEQV